jgi:hypothetical protein
MRLRLFQNPVRLSEKFEKLVRTAAVSLCYLVEPFQVSIL